VLSRVAEAVYWLHRYFERAENIARFIDVNLQLLLDLPADRGAEWAELVRSSGDELLFRKRHGEPDPASVMHFLTFDADYPNSILSCLRAARENGRAVRDVISSEMWVHLNKSYLMVREASCRPGVLDNPHAFFGEVKQAAHLFSGITDHTMSHDEAWHFGRLGGLLERADKTSRIVDVKCHLLEEGEPLGADEAQWAALLRSVSALEAYRKAWGRIEPLRVVEYLVFDRHFPRSMRHCLANAEGSLHAITGNPLDAAETGPERKLGRVRASLEHTELAELREAGLHRSLDTIQLKLNQVGEAIHTTFFSLEPLGEPEVAGAA
jgi:uncharacterized alpha-E superfamily protein